MKKLKRLLGCLALALLFSSAFAKEPAKPVTVTLAEANRWGTDATYADGVYENGTVTYTAMYRYGGGGYTFNINGKQGINLKDYSSVEIEFDYETGAWENSEIYPKFALKYFPSGASFYNGGQAISYFDADSMKGTIKQSFDISDKSGKALRVGIVANSWKWEGNGNGGDTGDDTVIIKVKSITFLP